MLEKSREVPRKFVENVRHIAPIVGDTLVDICTSNGFQPRSVVRGNNKIQGKSFWQLLKDKNLEIKQFLATTNSGNNTNPANGIGATPTTSTEQQDALKRAENIEGEVSLLYQPGGKKPII